MAYQRILVAIDLGSRSQVILQRAAQLAKHFQAQLIVITAIPDLRTLYHGTESKLRTSFSRELTEDAKDQLEQKCQRANVKPHQTIVAHGDADHVIAGEAITLDIDLIVFGNHDRHGLDHFVGGFGLGLLYRAHCDLLAVHTSRSEQDYASPLVAYADEPGDTHLLTQVRTHFPSNPLSLVHVVRRNLWSSKENGHAAQTAIMQKVTEFQPLQLNIVAGTPSAEIDNAAIRGNHGLIIMCSGRHSQLGWHLGSTAHNVLSRTHADVLLVRPQTENDR